MKKNYIVLIGLVILITIVGIQVFKLRVNSMAGRLVCRRDKARYLLNNVLSKCKYIQIRTETAEQKTEEKEASL